MSALTLPTRAVLLALVAGTLTLGCRIDRGRVDEEPTCVAQNADGAEMRCPAPDRAFSGDSCKCVETVTRNEYWGRVVNGE